MAHHKYTPNNEPILKLYEYSPKTQEEIEVASLIFNINNNILTIKAIERNSIAKRHFDENNHVGTEIFNRLLFDLEYKENVKFSKIYGKLSSADAKNNHLGIANWDSSIPFYSDFPKWLNNKLGYTLEFHLYDKEKCINEVCFPEDLHERKLFLEKFKQRHVELNMDASFSYIIKKNNHKEEFLPN